VLGQLTHSASESNPSISKDVPDPLQEMTSKEKLFSTTNAYSAAASDLGYAAVGTL
jgi:hypothetical protein